MGFLSSILSPVTNLLTGGSQAGSQAASNTLGQGQNFLSGVYNTAQQNLQPYQNTGATANATLSNILNGGNTNAMQPFFNSSTYQFPLQQGLQSIQNSQAAKGLGNSTAALRNAGGFTEGLASQNYQNFINNLMGLNTSGESAASSLGAIGGGIGQSYGNLTGQLANNQAIKAASPFAGLSSLLGGVGSILGSNGSSGGDIGGASGSSPWGTTLSNIGNTTTSLNSDAQSSGGGGNDISSYLQYLPMIASLFA